MNTSKIFNVTIKKLADDSLLHIIDIKEITPQLKLLVDNNLSKIHNGNRYDLSETKLALINFFSSKQKDSSRIGQIAEFFIHLYLVNNGLKQEFLLRNLEGDKELKNGFDGYYSIGDEAWIMESKSSNEENNNSNTHGVNLSEAYEDLSDKFSGKKPNPWGNAWNHAKIAGSKDGILKKIDGLDKEFQKKIFHHVEEFNIIPSSTIFLKNEWFDSDCKNIEKKADKWIEKKYNKLQLICITHGTVDAFLNYLK